MSENDDYQRACGRKETPLHGTDSFGSLPFGYILTKVDFHSFPRYDYISRTSLGELTGEILIDQALEFIKKSPMPDH